MVLTSVTTKRTISWDVTPCSPVEVHRCFRRNMSSPSSVCSFRRLLVGSFLSSLPDPKHGGGHVPSKRRRTFRGLHGVVSQNIELFNIVRFWNSLPTSQKTH
jgi:hypothetical protein